MSNWNFAVMAIDGYQQNISPYKGFCCAHRVVTGSDSCSEFAKTAIIENGFWCSLKAIRQRFSECKKAAAYLNKQKEEEKKRVGGSKESNACLAVDPFPCGEMCVGGIGAVGCDGCACTPF
jgi:putative component of membrane protein insertase Oxa1/YidC/SpoIIIJ protein YidD